MKIQEKLQKFADDISKKYGRLKYLIGILFILFGLFALVTPFTPGAIVTLAIGLELVGIKLISKDFNFLKRKNN